MSATFNSTTVQSILKRYFKVPAVQNQLAAKQTAIWKFMKKTTDGEGDYCTFTQILSDPFTVNVDFSKAQTLAQNSTVTPGLKYNMPWQELNTPIRVSAKANQLTRTNKGAWFQAIGLAAASAMRMSYHVLSIQALTSGFGELANYGIGYSGSGANFTVSRGAINRFVEGMPLVFADSIHGDALRSATAVKAASVDYGSNTVTASAALTTVSAVDGDFVFLDGSRENSGTPSRVNPVGLRTWYPDVRPVTDTTISTVEGTVRSGNTRSYGCFVDASNMDDMDGLQLCLQQCNVIGNATEATAFVSEARHAAMSKKLSSDKRFTASDAGNRGFGELYVIASGIKAKLEIDRNLEDDVGYILKPGSYECVGAGEVPFIQDTGGGQWVRVSDDNSTELRVYAVYAYIMNDPAAGGVVKFADLS
jgi:hypothetical protein